MIVISVPCSDRQSEENIGDSKVPSAQMQSIGEVKIALEPSRNVEASVLGNVILGTAS